MMELNLTRVDYTQVCHLNPVMMISDVYMLSLKRDATTKKFVQV